MRVALNKAAMLCLVGLFALLSACGATGSQREAVVTITLSGGKAASVQRIEVSGGATVKLTVASDAADTIHVHGYDLEFAVPAGGEVTKQFVANQLGSYEIETHTSNQIVAQLVVR